MPRPRTSRSPTVRSPERCAVEPRTSPIRRAQRSRSRRRASRDGPAATTTPRTARSSRWRRGSPVSPLQRWRGRRRGGAARPPVRSTAEQRGGGTADQRHDEHRGRDDEQHDTDAEAGDRRGGPRIAEQHERHQERTRSPRRGDHRLVDDDDRDPQCVHGPEPGTDVRDVRRPVAAGEVRQRQTASSAAAIETTTITVAATSNRASSRPLTPVSRRPVASATLRRQQGEPTHREHGGGAERRR